MLTLYHVYDEKNVGAQGSTHLLNDWINGYEWADTDIHLIVNSACTLFYIIIFHNGNSVSQPHFHVLL